MATAKWTPRRRTVAREGALTTVALLFGALEAMQSSTHPGLLHFATGVAATLAAQAVRLRSAEAGMVAAVLATLVQPLGGIVILVATAFRLGRTVQNPVRVMLFIVGAAVVGSTFDVVTGKLTQLWPTLFFSLGLSLFFAGVPALAGSLVGVRKPLVSALRERNAYLEQARALAAANARSDERTRIAGEMHDLLGHHLSLLSVHAGALEYRAAGVSEEFAQQAQLVRTTAGTALGELRQILGVLRPDHGPDAEADAPGTKGDLEGLVARSRDAGTDVALRWSGEDLEDADPRTARAVHRTVREGLTNAHKHAAGAPVVVDVVRDGNDVEVTVLSGAPVAGSRTLPGTGRGLFGLAERARLTGGTCVGERTDDGGFRLRLRVPLTPPDTVQAVDDGPPPPDDGTVLTARRMVGVGCLLALVWVPGLLLLGALLGTLMLTNLP